MKHSRQLADGHHLAPCIPHGRILRHLPRVSADSLCHPGQIGSCSLADVRDFPKGSVQGFHPAHVIRVLRAGRRLRNKADTAGQLQGSLLSLAVSAMIGMMTMSVTTMMVMTMLMATEVSGKMEETP